MCHQSDGGIAKNLPLSDGDDFSFLELAHKLGVSAQTFWKVGQTNEANLRKIH